MAGVNDVRASGVVPVQDDDATAPGGSPALRSLSGGTLVRRAVQLLIDAAVEPVVVVVPPGLVEVVRDALRGLDPAVVDVIGAGAAGGSPDLRELLLRALSVVPAGRPVLIHDPAQPLVTAEQVAAVLRALTGVDDLVVPVHPVTDTLKWVDAEDRIVATADREHFRAVCSPLAGRVPALRAALSGPAAPGAGPPTAGLGLLPERVRAGGGRVRLIRSGAELLRIAGSDDLVQAEHLLAAAGRARKP